MKKIILLLGRKKKRSHKLLLTLSIVSLSFITILILLCPIQTSGQISNQRSAESDNILPQGQIPDVQFGNNKLYIGIWLINIFDYQYTRGNYILDMYLYFFWTDPNITTVSWQLANGYPVTPTSITLIDSNTTDEVKHEVYRAIASLNSAVDAKDFPFDQINITVAIDVFPKGRNITLMWLSNQTGIDPQFNNPGWKTNGFETSITGHSLPLGVQAPKAEVVVTQQRQKAGASIQPFIAPALFALVSFISFLFGLRDPPSVGLRLGLNTSMLITTLLFSFSISGAIPPSSSVSLYAAFLLSVLIFIVVNLSTTIIGVVYWTRSKNEKGTLRINRLGLMLSFVVPILIFLILYTISA